MVVQKSAAAQSNFGNQFSRQRIKSAEDSHQNLRPEVTKMMRMLGMIMFIIMMKTDMKFVQNFTPPDFQVKNFTPSILPNFNSLC